MTDNAVYSVGKTSAVVVSQSAVAVNFVALKEITQNANKFSPFAGVKLSMFDIQDVKEGQVHAYYICIHVAIMID